MGSPVRLLSVRWQVDCQFEGSRGMSCLQSAALGRDLLVSQEVRQAMD